MLQVKSGKTELLGLLYERYKKWLYNFFYQMYQDAATCEDLVQNVFMRVLKYKHTFSEKSKFVTWLFQIARNESHDYYNKQIKNHKDLPLDDVNYKLSEMNNSEEMEEKKAELQLMHRAISKLPYEQKEIITLSKLRQLQYSEIGDILGCSEGNARIKAHRALQNLKTTFHQMQKI